MHAITAFSGFSVKSLKEAEKFYSGILGLKVEDNRGMGLLLHLPGSTTTVFVYEKENHAPASFTILNFVVEDIDKAVADLHKKGVKLEIYEGSPHDKKGIVRGRKVNMGPDIAWFADPSGNIISVLQDKE